MTRILLIDDHSLFREAIARLLGREQDFEIVGECATVGEGMVVLRSSAVDVVLLDINLGLQQGGAFLPLARDAGFKGKILVVTAGVSRLEAGRLVERGCAGIILKQERPEVLIERIREITGHLDCLIGNEEDLQKGLGLPGQDVQAKSHLDPESFFQLIEQAVQQHPNIRLVATTLREVHSTNRHGWIRTPTTPVMIAPVRKEIRRGHRLAKSLAGLTTLAARLVASVARHSPNSPTTCSTGLWKRDSSTTGSHSALP